MNSCPYCEKQNDFDADICANCGARLKPRDISSTAQTQRGKGGAFDGIPLALLSGLISAPLALLSVNEFIIKVFFLSNVACLVASFILATSGKRAWAIICALAPIPLSFSIIIGISRFFPTFIK